MGLTIRPKTKVKGRGESGMRGNGEQCNVIKWGRKKVGQREGLPMEGRGDCHRE